jgi:hypothetical protein
MLLSVNPKRAKHNTDEVCVCPTALRSDQTHEISAIQLKAPSPSYLPALRQSRSPFLSLPPCLSPDRYEGGIRYRNTRQEKPCDHVRLLIQSGMVIRVFSGNSKLFAVRLFPRHAVIFGLRPVITAQLAKWGKQPPVRSPRRCRFSRHTETLPVSILSCRPSVAPPYSWRGCP